MGGCWNNTLLNILMFLSVFYESVPDFPMDSNNGNCRGSGIGEYSFIKLCNELHKHVPLMLDEVRAVLSDA